MEIQNNVVFSFMNFNDTLYIGGSFYSTSNNVDNIAFWNGAQWNPLGPGMLGGVRCMTVYNNELHAAGHFLQIGGNQLARGIARWDGTNWNNLEGGITNGTVRDIIPYYGELYVVGSITSIDSSGMIDIGKWNGNSWSPVCTISGGLSTIFSATVFNNELYIGGYFSSVNGQTMFNIARFDGVNWSDVGGGVYGDVFDMFPDTINNRLYIVGNVTSLNGGSIPCPTNVAYWDGFSWYAVGNNPDMHPNTIFQYNNEMYVGFTSPRINNNGDTLNYIAKWDGTDWQPLGNGLNSAVHAIIGYENELVAGGAFSQAGSVVANRVASWSDSTTSIESIDTRLNGIKIYPNPITESANIELSDTYLNMLPVKLDLYDIHSKKVFATEIKELKQVVKFMLENGNYFYKIYTNSKILNCGQILILKPNK